MKKLGYVEGQGLGKEGTGRINPIQDQQRGKNVGLGYGAASKGPSIIEMKKVEEKKEIRVRA